MGSKVIILLGLLASGLYLYFFINKQNIIVPQEKIVNIEIENRVEKTKDFITPEAESKEESTTTPELKDEKIEVVNERISTPAFGFMAGEKKNQIVGLMSDNDEDGVLPKYIEELCQKVQCSKDMRYEKDIIDAPWQTGVGKIIELLTDGSIEDGSLFIEGNVLKLEGTVINNEAQGTLKSILKSIKSDNFKIEDHSKLSVNAENEIEDKLKPVEQIIKKDENVKVKSINDVKTIKTKESAKQKTAIKTDEIKTKAKQEIKKTSKMEIKPQPIKKSKAVKKIKSKAKSIKHKPVVKVSMPEILPEPVMTTTLDLDKQITTEHSIKENIPAEDLVAKPYLKITSQNNDILQKKVKKTRALKKEIVAKPVMITTLDSKSKNKINSVKRDIKTIGLVANPNMETTSQKNSEAQREIRDLLIANPIRFEFRSSIITKESRNILDKIVQIVNESEDSNIIIEGFIDSGSDKVYNKDLSQKRADMIKRYLKSKNIKSKTIKSIGYSKNKPITKSSNDTKDGSIEILFISGETK